MSILNNLISIVLLFTLAHAFSPLQNPTGLTGTNYRLSEYVWPWHYIIKLAPNLKLGDFKGELSVKISVFPEYTKTITLHAQGLTFDEKSTTLVNVINNETVKPVNHTIDNETDFFTVVFARAIPRGTHWLNLKYTGFLSEDSRGFQRSSYVNETGETVWLASTHFQPTYARRVFPCFDEPAMKATFEISINHLKIYNALSNMPVKNQTEDNDDLQKIWTNFENTRLMSTYLVAFVVSDFVNKSSDKKLSCWSQKKKNHYCQYAVEIGPKILGKLKEYTSTRYGSPKLDNVALPTVEYDAMEDWGLVTYQEKILLYEEGVSTTSQKQYTTMAICHEYAHQWFGNLVTPAWWDYLWLSEGLAVYLHYFIADMVERDWRFMDQMVVHGLQESALWEDSMSYWHPMNAKVNSPSEILGLMNVITYNKTACVIRMISHILGAEVFQTGLRQYLKKNKHGVVTSDHLFEALVTAAKDFPNNIPLKEALNLWANQPGFPVIHVNRLSASPGYVSITQTRFSDDGPSNLSSTESWWIPVNYATQSNPNFNDTKASHWLSPTGDALEIPLQLSNNEWVIFNKQETGYYRVNYDKENWALITDYLNTENYTKVHVLNRAQLLDDSYNLALKNYLDSVGVFLNISRYLVREVDYIPWHPAFRAFETLHLYVQNTEEYDDFKSYILKLIMKVENKVGYSEMPGDDHLTKLNRVKVINWACKMGSVKCADATRESLIEHINGRKKISPDLREVIFCAGIATANETIWLEIFDLYLEAVNINEEDAKFILNALGCSSDPNILDTYLLMLIDEDSKGFFGNEEALAVLRAVGQNTQAGIDIVLDFMIHNLETLINSYGESLWSSLFEGPTISRIDTTPLMEMLEECFKKIPIKNNSTLASIKSIRNTVSNLIKSMENWRSQIRLFLKSQNLVDG